MVTKSYELVSSLKKILNKHRAKTIHTEEFRVTCEEIYLKLPKALKDDSTRQLVTKLLEESRKTHPEKRIAKRICNRLEKDLYMKKINHQTPREQEIVKTSQVIKDLISAISNKDEQDFLEESYDCITHGNIRSGIIMAWCATIWKIYDQIAKTGFKEFMKASNDRFNKKKKKVKKKDDLLYYQDSEILLLGEDIGIFDRNIRRSLEDALALRNKCAHPGKYKPGIKKVDAYFEDIISCIF